jgi:hypothetical protein
MMMQVCELIAETPFNQYIGSLQRQPFERYIALALRYTAAYDLRHPNGTCLPEFRQSVRLRLKHR